MSEATAKAGAMLLDAVQDEIAELERLRAAEEEAAAEVKRVEDAIFQAELAWSKRKEETRRPDRRYVLARAALDGVEPPPEEPIPAGPRVEDLAATAEGLKAMRVEAEKLEGEAHSALRARVAALFPLAGQRLAQDYLAAAERLATLHTAICAAEFGRTSLPGAAAKDALFGTEWTHNFAIPSSDLLQALRGKGWNVYGRTVLGGGDESVCHRTGSDALDAAKAEIRRRLGGRWPFDRR